MSVMPGVTRGGSGWARGTRCLCVQRDFLLPRTSHRLSTPTPESLRPRNLPVRRWRVNSLLGSSARGGAGAVRVPGGLARAVCSAWRSSLRVDAAAPEAGAAKGSCERASHTGLGGPASGFFCGALQLELVGARCAAPAALLRRESPFPSDGACADANERAARGSQRDTGAGVRAGAVAGRWQKVQRRTFEARRLGGREGRGRTFS